MVSRRAACASVLLLLASVAGTSGDARAQGSAASQRAAFALEYHGSIVPWRQFLLRARPGERVALQARPAADALGSSSTAAERLPAGSFEASASAGSVQETGPRRWTWQAPTDPGLYRLVVRWRSEAPGTARDSIVLTAAVLVPLSEIDDGRVRGYRVGEYPDEVFRGLPRYQKPRGFIRLEAADADVPVSPHFRLGQFSVRRPDAWPKHTVLHERLLIKMELLVERAARRGISPSGWKVLSAFRSPWYNASIGRPRFSRHIFGDAADLYVDADGDGRQDDLNGDGRVDVRDAKVLYDIVERMDEDSDLRPLLGGLGRYGTTSTHGPFIHVDTRGYRARW